MMNGISAVVGGVMPAGKTGPAGSAAEPTQTEAFGVAMLLALLSGQTPVAQPARAAPAGQTALTTDQQAGNVETRSQQAGQAGPGRHGAVPLPPAGSNAFTAGVRGAAAPAEVVPTAATAPRMLGGLAKVTGDVMPAAHGKPAAPQVGVGRLVPPTLSPQLGATAVASRATTMPHGHRATVRSPGPITHPAESSPRVIAAGQTDARPLGPVGVRQPTLWSAIAAPANSRAEPKPVGVSPGVTSPNADAEVPQPQARRVSPPAFKQQGLRPHPAALGVDLPPGQRPALAPRTAPVVESLKSQGASATQPDMQAAPARIAPAAILLGSVTLASGTAAPQTLGTTLPTSHRGKAAPSGGSAGAAGRSDLIQARERPGGGAQPSEAAAVTQATSPLPLRRAHPNGGHTAERERGWETVSSGDALPSGQSRASVAEGVAHSMAARLGGGPDRPAGPQAATVGLKAEQAEPSLRAEQPVVRPSLTDRVTVKFTDPEGIEGRVRVAVRGQAVRATIVSEDPTVARRLGEHIAELQQTLDQQGFRDSQIAVQHVRRGAELGAIALGTVTRSAADVSAAASRAPEEHGNRERTQHDQRDHQGSNNNRSQQRSRQREER